MGASPPLFLQANFQGIEGGWRALLFLFKTKILFWKLTVLKIWDLRSFFTVVNACCVLQVQQLFVLLWSFSSDPYWVWACVQSWENMSSDASCSVATALDMLLSHLRYEVIRSFWVIGVKKGSWGLDYGLISRAHFQPRLFCDTLVPRGNIFVWSILPTLIWMKGFTTVEPIPVYAIIRRTDGGKKMD